MLLTNFRGDYVSICPSVEPKIGSWHENRRNRQFEVVAYDAHEQLVEIQYFDDAISELELP